MLTLQVKTKPPDDKNHDRRFVVDDVKIKKSQILAKISPLSTNNTIHISCDGHVLISFQFSRLVKTSFSLVQFHFISKLSDTFLCC